MFKQVPIIPCPHVLALMIAITMSGNWTGLAAGSPNSPEIRYYVSPSGDDQASGRQPDQAFASIGRAQQAIRDLKQAGGLKAPVTVLLRGGTYSMDQPLAFGPLDSGSEVAPVTYTAYPGERPVLHGGRRVAGWRKEANGLWSAPLPVQEPNWRFRQLYVNGERRPRARMPNEGFFRVAGFPDGGREVHYHTDCQRFEFKPGDLDANWARLRDVEVIVYHFWTDSHLPIQSIDTRSNIVTFKHKAGKVFTDDFTAGGARYIVENVFEGLDQPGEWYLNRETGRVYYLPKPGEDMERVEVIAPALPHFMKLEGQPVERAWVENLAFRGIAFQYTCFDLPPGNSNDQQGSASVPAAVSLAGARNCAFQDCEFSHLGTFAFEIGKGCTGNAFVGNKIHHLAAGGFRVNGGTERNHPLEQTGHNRITDNHLAHFGQEFPSAVGILLMHTHGNEVSHNLIHDGWYTGISVGWVWGYQRSISRDNRIEYNHIHHIGQGLLSDMGGIYTLGVAPGTVIRNNLIHDVEANHYGGWGIYHDEGSTHVLVESNIVFNTKFAGFNIHFAKEITARNNIFALGRLEQISRTRVEPHKSAFFENNIIYWKEGELYSKNWKDEPYTFYFHPKNKSGTAQVTSTFEADWNLYFNPQLERDKVQFAKEDFAAWQKRGKDAHSLYADPLFVDVEKFDFRLKPESPAFQLGFRPIDMSTVGPRQR